MNGTQLKIADREIDLKVTVYSDLKPSPKKSNKFIHLMPNHIHINIQTKASPCTIQYPHVPGILCSFLGAL